MNLLEGSFQVPTHISAIATVDARIADGTNLARSSGHSRLASRSWITLFALCESASKQSKCKATNPEALRSYIAKFTTLAGMALHAFNAFFARRSRVARMALNAAEAR